MKISIIGGGGHVGLPLSIALAEANNQNFVTIIDINEETNKLITNGIMPFKEEGAKEKLLKVIGKNLFVSNKHEEISNSDVIIIIIGTPVDEHLNPSFKVFKEFIKSTIKYFKDDQTIILRSTVYPGTSEKIN